MCVHVHMYTHTHAWTHRPAASSNRTALWSQFFPALPGSWGSDAGCQACSTSTFTHWATLLEPRSSHVYHFPHVGLSFDMWRIRLRLRKYTSISNIAAKRYCSNEWKLECTRTPRGKKTVCCFCFLACYAVFHILTSFYLNTLFVLEEAYYSPRWFLGLIKLGQFSFESTAETWYDKILSCE